MERREEREEMSLWTMMLWAMPVVLIINSIKEWMEV